jgi:hypothetical protein
MREFQPILLLNDTPHSRAGSLPQKSKSKSKTKTKTKTKTKAVHTRPLFTTHQAER